MVCRQRARRVRQGGALLGVGSVSCRSHDTRAGRPHGRRDPADTCSCVLAPSYPQGVIDPVAEIAAAAAERASAATSTPASAAGRCRTCAGWGGRAAVRLRRPGVTSISVDLHKSPTAQGRRRPPAPRRALRATAGLRLRRWPGYTMVTRDRLDQVGRADRRRLGRAAPPRRRRLPAAGGGTRAAVPAWPPPVRWSTCCALWPSRSRLSSFHLHRCPGPDLFVLADELAARGWHTQPQLSYADLPAGVHLTVTAAVAPGSPRSGRAWRSRGGRPGRWPGRLPPSWRPVGRTDPRGADPGTGGWAWLPRWVSSVSWVRAGTGAAAGAHGTGEHAARRRTTISPARAVVGRVRRSAATTRVGFGRLNHSGRGPVPRPISRSSG